jgi:O-antigen ligase
VETPVEARRPRALALPIAGATPAAAALAVALPILFLHVKYQLGVRVPLGSTHLGLELSDAVVWLAAAVAIREGLRAGFGPIRPGRAVWIAGAALLGWIAVCVLHPLLWQDGYSWLKHAVTAAKFGEYALLALAVPLLLRRRGDLVLVYATATAWSVVATVVGLAQFVGADLLDAWPAGRRQPSFLGHLDFAALSGFVLALGLAGILFRPAPLRRPWATAVALVSGGLGLVLSGASAGMAGMLAGAVAMLFVAFRRRLLAPRQVLAVTGIALVVSAGVFALRARDFDQFLRFLGVEPQQASTQGNVQTYAHHTLLAYVGYRIWREHPVAGAGWQASSEQETYGPVLPAVHARFPDQPALAFPAPGRDYGVQNAYVQALADLGVVGLVAWLGLFAAGLLVALKAALRGPPEDGAVAAFALVLALGLWGAQGLVAGLPLDALTWLGAGLAVAAAARIRRTG